MTSVRIKTFVIVSLLILILIIPCGSSKEMSCEADGTCDTTTTTTTTTEEIAENEESNFEENKEGTGEGEGVETEEEEICRDVNDQCQMWASQGECTANSKYMSSNCKFSCKLCQCKDLNKQCEQWASEGECMVDTVYMEHYCRKSCLLCTDIVRSDSAMKDRLIKRQKIFVEMDLGVKQEINQNDNNIESMHDRLRKMDQYIKNKVTQPWYDDVRDSCKNNHKFCIFWASTGQCENNPGYMLKDCVLACLACQRLNGFRKYEPLRKVGVREDVFVRDVSKMTLAERMRLIKRRS